MQRILEILLGQIARWIRHSRKPRVIAVVGSVGKSSAKEAIYQVVSSSFSVRRAEGSYNNELGVPLTIIGRPASGKNIVGWLGTFLKGLALGVGIGEYPSFLVLEFGESAPGDIKALMKIVRPEVVVVTAIERVHIEFFKSFDAVIKEIGSAVSLLPSSGKAILNADDEHVRGLAKTAKCSVVTYGTRNDADLVAEQLSVATIDGSVGLSIRVAHKGTTVPLFVPGIPATHQAYAILAACSVGIHCGMNLVSIGNALRSYQPPKGRTNLIEGIKGSLIIDDTYNASPAASLAALKTLHDIPVQKAGRRIAVFGDMLELGSFTEEGHRAVGTAAVEAGITMVYTVGPLAHFIADAARIAGLHGDHVRELDSREEAITELQALIEEGDVVLIKGSQGARMEHVVKALMAKPEEASERLVRQSKRWQSKG